MGNDNQTTSRVKIVGPIPAIDISLDLMFPTPATMAFGGVPTGKWKAMQQLRAAGNIRYRGCTSMAMAWKEGMRIVIKVITNHNTLRGRK